MNTIVWEHLKAFMQDTSSVTPLLHQLHACGINLEACFVRCPELWQSYGIINKWDDLLHALAAFNTDWVNVVFADFVPAASKFQSWPDSSVSQVSWYDFTVQRLMVWCWWLDALRRGPSVKLLKLCMQELPSAILQQNERDGLDYRMLPFMKLSNLELEDDAENNTGCVLFESFAKGLLPIVGSSRLDSASQWWPPVLLAACRWCCHFMDRSEGRLNLDRMSLYFSKLNGVNREFRREALELLVKLQKFEETQGGHCSTKTFNMERVAFKFSDALEGIEMHPPMGVV